MSGTGGLFSHFPYYHARELPAPPLLPCPFAVQLVVAVTAYPAPRAGLTHLELLLRQFPLTIPTNHILFTLLLFYLVILKTLVSVLLRVEAHLKRQHLGKNT